MTITDDAIENLADSLCRLGKPEYRPLYVESMKAIARMAQSELVLMIELDFEKSMHPQNCKKT